MAVDEESVSKVFSVLSHPLRRRILQNLNEKEECSFTDLMNALNVDTGKLSFHIRGLGGFIEQTSTGKYKLNRAGQNAIRLVKELESWVEEAKVLKKTSELQLATFKKRTFAFLIDLLLVFAIANLTTLPNAFSLLTGGGGSVILFATLALLWGYSTLLEGFRGQSLGKRIIRLQVVRIDGRNLSYDYAAVRNFGKAFLLPFDLAIGIRLKDKRFLRYFDKFAGTTVIDLRPQA
jgi:uncharacterized RDD family membrane protein YckC/DNA-binding transcriptional ArsR family regulator